MQPAATEPGVARRFGRARLRRGVSRRRSGSLWRNRGGSPQGADRTRALRRRLWSKAHALARFSDRGPRPARRGVAGRFDRRARIDRRCWRSAVARRRVSRRARLHAWASPRARRRDALGGRRCQREMASFSTSAAAPRDAPGQRRQPATFTATARGYDLILDGRAGDPPARRGLSSAEVAQLLAREGASLFAGAGPT